MAKPDDEKAARIRFMKLIGERIGVDVQQRTDFIRRMKWSATKPNATKNVKNWADGSNGPNFEDTMDMLSEASLLAPAALSAWLGRPATAAELAADARGAAEGELDRQRAQTKNPRRSEGAG